ncbi:MAG TPA: copper chaperone PCu(A)C [Gammaproteobacteria bacterium]
MSMLNSVRNLFIACCLNLLMLSFSMAADALSFSQATVPQAPPGAQVMASFMQIANNSDQDIDIIAVSSPQFESVEMHLSKDVDGIARMLPQHKLSINAGQTLILKPGSYHLMLIKPLKALSDGDTVELNFSLSSEQMQTLQVTVSKNRGASRGMRCGAGKCGSGKCGGN